LKGASVSPWSEASEHGKGLTGQPGITNAVLVQTAMELDPTAAREAEQAGAYTRSPVSST
jgi:hypothetical protein